jgi:hypothetical protein
MAKEREREGSGSERENVWGGGEEVKSTCGVSGWRWGVTHSTAVSYYRVQPAPHSTAAPY